MKGLYKLAVAFEKAAQGVPSVEQIREISEKGPFGGAFTSHAPASPAMAAIDPYIQMSLNKLGYEPQIKVDGILGPETKGALEWFKRNHGLPNMSPDLLDKQVRAEVAKLKGNNQVAFKVPGESAKPVGSPIGPVGDHKVPGNISAEPQKAKNTGDLIADIQNKR